MRSVFRAVSNKHYTLQKLPSELHIEAPVFTFLNGVLFMAGSALKKIMGRETIKIAELEIFHAVRRWLEEKLDGRAEAAFAEDLVLSCVRLRDLALDELLGTVRESKLVSDSAILDAVKQRKERNRLIDVDQ